MIINIKPSFKFCLIGNTRDIFNRLKHPRLKSFYDQIVISKHLIDEDNPEEMWGSFEVTNFDDLSDVLSILGEDGGIKGEVELYFILENKERGIYAQISISTNRPFKRGEIHIDEKAFDSHMRNAAISAHKILDNAIATSPDLD